MFFDFTVLKSAVESPLNDSYPLRAQNPGGLCGTDALNENSRKLVKKKKKILHRPTVCALHDTPLIFTKNTRTVAKDVTFQVSSIVQSKLQKRKVKASRLHDTKTSLITFNSLCRPFCFYALQNSSFTIPITVIHQLSTKTTIQYP